MSLQRKVYVVGGHITPFIGKNHPDFVWKGHPDFGKRENPTLEETITAAVRGAFVATGVPASAVQKAWIGNFVGELFSSQGHLGAALVGADPGLRNKPAMRVEGACASGGLAFASAVESIQAGTDVALVAGAEVQTTVSARIGGDYLARASHYKRERSIDDFTFPALFARRAKHLLETTELTEEDLGRVAVKAYANANKNPLAHMQAVRMDLATASKAGDKNPAFLSNPELTPYMKMSDCSQVSDGGAALILVSEKGLAALGLRASDATEVLAVEVATGDLYVDGDPGFMETSAAACGRAFEASGVARKDVGVLEVHDCFTVTELLMLEALGFAPRGRGFELVREGRTGIDGDLPVNTGGGLVGFGHPVGATGVKQILELHRQIHGQCGDYQIPTRPTVGAAINMGGNDKTAVATVVRAG
jgi:acetyl-CoA acyltransferase